MNLKFFRANKTPIEFRYSLRFLISLFVTLSTTTRNCYSFFTVHMWFGTWDSHRINNYCLINNLCHCFSCCSCIVHTNAECNTLVLDLKRFGGFMGRLLRGEGKGGFYGFSIFGIFFRGFWRKLELWEQKFVVCQKGQINSSLRSKSLAGDTHKPNSSVT